MDRKDVFIANCLKCRPPDNRDPYPHELGLPALPVRQVELIEPSVICTLGNFSTKLLRGDPTGISRIHGQAEVRTIGPRAVRLYPLYHPAAALYTPSTLEMLRADFLRIPELVRLGPPTQPMPIDPVPEHEEPVLEPVIEPQAQQLGSVLSGSQRQPVGDARLRSPARTAPRWRTRLGCLEPAAAGSARSPPPVRSRSGTRRA